MKKVNRYEMIAAYDCGEGFVVDVIKKDGYDIEVWIWHEDYASKMFMFGVPPYPIDELEEMIEREASAYKEFYREEHMNE